MKRKWTQRNGGKTVDEHPGMKLNFALTGYIQSITVNRSA